MLGSWGASPKPVTSQRKTQVTSQTFPWRGFPTRYQACGATGPAVVCIHGFGASSDHWRKNLPILGQTCQVYALDLIGFGGSAKPKPSEELDYTFETWGQQVVDFCQTVVGRPAVLVGNSIGAVVALQAAVVAPDWVKGVGLLNCSLRLLHQRRRASLPWYRRWGAPLLQNLLGYHPLGHQFFRQVAQPQVITRILRQAYGDPATVTQELVEAIYRPAVDPGAADVFLAFVRYDSGPLPEDLLPKVTCPVWIAWGTADPWEPLNMGQQLAEYPAVQDFRPLEGVGHCPQDEAPDQVNALLLTWLQAVDQDNQNGGHNSYQQV
ncbi:MAG: alpha/beta fold hydrolase [Gloeomargaritaceae cyanobacterium C42_A2020_066]|nr:alpha/beta fold hydrolase [Gloeomargaritaceae cyanobacterium C42_A2020_066]